MRSIIKNKRGGFTDLFLFIVISLILVLFSVVFIYIGGITSDKLHETMDTMDIGGDLNVSETIDQTVGKTNVAYQSLTWITVLLIVGMTLSIFIGSYLVTTKPIFFIPYIFITIIAVIVSAGISNAYNTLLTSASTTELATSFSGFAGSNWILLHLPIWVTIVGITGAIIMFARMGAGRDELYYG